MPALNRDDTERLLQVVKTFAGILEEGYNPAKAAAGDRLENFRKKTIEQAAANVKTIAVSRGHRTRE